jgi:hypothetical protein
VSGAFAGAAVAGLLVMGIGAVGGPVAASFAQAPRGPRPERRAPPPATPPAPVQVGTHLNRTAVWVGDSVEWTVEFICPPSYDVIADDLAADKLQLEGLEMIGAATERTASPDGGLVVRVTYQLRTYEIGLPALRVAPFTVRYFVHRAGQRAEDLAPAGQLGVPGAQLAWRSTLPGDLKAVDLRVDRGGEPTPALFRAARPTGLTLVVLSVVPVALWAFGWLRQVRLPRERRPSQRAARREAKRALQALLSADVSTEPARRDAYGDLSAILRRYLLAVSGTSAAALTFEEVTTRVGTRSGAAGEAVAEALAECDRACYAGSGAIPSADQFRDSVTLLAGVL